MPASRPTALVPGGTNAIGRMLGLLGDEWNLLIIQQALMGASRYSQFVARLPISNAVLTSRLRKLVDEGLLSRRAKEYLTTARSRSLWPILLSVWEWERTWVVAQNDRLPVMHHRHCGELFAPLLGCRACGMALHGDDVDFAPGPSGQWFRSAPGASTRRRVDSDASSRQAGLFPETMTVLGNRWAAAILVAAFLETTRFTDFQNQLGAPPSLLADRLQRFCAIEVLTSAPAQRDGSGRAPYLLTDKGRAFGGVLVVALQWAQRWFVAPEGPAVIVRHRSCGAALIAELACDRCDGRLAGAQVAVTVLKGSPAEMITAMAATESL